MATTTGAKTSLELEASHKLNGHRQANSNRNQIKRQHSEYELINGFMASVSSPRPNSSASVSPSSQRSITTDSDSMLGCEQGQKLRDLRLLSPDHLSQGEQTESSQLASQINGSNRSTVATSTSPRVKAMQSPILIKYNYYDYNGERQENHDINQFSVQTTTNNQSSVINTTKPIQRQLSPTFKQSLDQIVRSSQNIIKQQQQISSSSNSSSPISPTSGQAVNNYHRQDQNQQHTMTLLARRYKLSSYKHRCLRCSKTVYQMDKVGPLKDFTFYHHDCFKCRECGTKLTLKTYFNNQHSSTDLEVYCNRHCPKTPAGKLDNQSVGIRAALNAPKVFDPIHQQAFDPAQLIGNASGVANYPSQHHLLTTIGNYNNNNNNNNGNVKQPLVDSRALHIQHAVQQTRLQSIYKQSQVDKKISQFLNRRLEFLEPKQKLLEMRHREEEEQLFKVFEQKWHQEESQIRDQIRDEWQQELNKLLEKYRRQLSANLTNGTTLIGSGSSENPEVAMRSEMKAKTAGKKMSQQQVSINGQKFEKSEFATQLQPKRIDFHMASKLNAANLINTNSNNQDNEQKMIEIERMNLEKTMTIKLDRKKETLKRKLKEFERQATAELVEKQSREMLTLISLKLEEFKEEQKRKIGSDLEHFEAIESLANHLGASLQVDNVAANNNATVLAPSTLDTNDQQQQQQQRVQLPVKPLTNEPIQQAPPKAPQLSKMELYNSEQADEVFKEIDELAINVAKEDQRTFTDLVHHLTRHCLTDVEKVRAIFRWITVKNLNTMQFDDATIKPDTPLGLLRGIKQGSESYHVLFKRLCSYAGLHCVVIKGFSKSAGYQPGVRFEGSRFRNSWNAVFIAGAWRFVQCNWGARHLVSVAVMQDKNSSSNSNKSSSNGKLLGPNNGRSSQQAQLAKPIDRSPLHQQHQQRANLGRRGQSNGLTAPVAHLPAPLQVAAQYDAVANQHHQHSRHQRHRHRHHHNDRDQEPSNLMAPISPGLSSSASSTSTSYSNSSSSSSCSSPSHLNRLTSSSDHQNHRTQRNEKAASSLEHNNSQANDSLRYEYDDHYFLTDPDEFIYEFFPAAPEWQLLKTRPLSLNEFEQLPFVRSLFFKYGLYFPQAHIKSVLHTNSSGATTVKIGMPTHMIPSLIFHYNLKYFDSDVEHHDGISLKRFVMQSVESGATSSDGIEAAEGEMMLSNIVSFRVHVPENGAYILDIFANSTTPTQYITGEPMKFKSVCKFKIIAKNLKTVMVPLPDCASGEYGPMKATRLFGIIPITHENGLISVQNDKRFVEIQFRMTRPLLDFMASLHKNGCEERQLSKLIKIVIDGDIVFIAIKFLEDGQYGLDIYTRDQTGLSKSPSSCNNPNCDHSMDNLRCQASFVQASKPAPKKQLLTHCCKYLINVRAPTGR